MMIMFCLVFKAAQESFLTWIFSVSLPAFGFFICLCMCCLYFLEFCTGKKKKEEKEPQEILMYKGGFPESANASEVYADIAHHFKGSVALVLPNNRPLGVGDDHFTLSEVFDLPPPLEKRRAQDGCSYTRQQFMKYFGKASGELMWSRASVEKDVHHVGPLGMLEKCNNHTLFVGASCWTSGNAGKVQHSHTLGTF